MPRIIYFDHAATTPLKPAVLDAMLPYFHSFFGNPSGIYSISTSNHKAMTQARHEAASFFNAKDHEIYFSASATESDNWALKGIAEANRHKGNHIITSSIEHHAVLHTCQYLETVGFEVTYLPVDESGCISLEELASAIRPSTILVSIMFANNEIGTIEPIKEIGLLCHERHIIFHTDAVQAISHCPIDVEEYHIDLLSASAHKIGGPKGVGLLYIRSGIKISSLLHGGSQERHRRAGTENLAGIIGFAKALSLIEFGKRQEELAILRDYLSERILREIPFSRLNGSTTNRLSGNVNISFQFIEGESLLIMLDQKGICASSGSACTSGSLDPSHVLLAIGRSHDEARGSLRLTIGETTTIEEIDFVVDELKQIISRLRSMSPAFCQSIKE